MQNLKLGMSVGDYRMNCCRSLRTTNLHELRSIFFFVETTADCSGLFDFVHVFGASELVQLTVAWCAQCCLVVMNFLSNLVEKRVTLGVFFPFNLCVRKRDKSGQISISHLPCTNMSLQRKWRLLSQYCIQARILSSTKKQSSFFFPHSRVVQVLSSAWRSQRISFCLHDERRRSSKTSRGSFEGSVPSLPLRHPSIAQKAESAIGSRSQLEHRVSPPSCFISTRTFPNRQHCHQFFWSIVGGPMCNLQLSQKVRTVWRRLGASRERPYHDCSVVVCPPTGTVVGYRAQNS